MHGCVCVCVCVCGLFSPQHCFVVGVVHYYSMGLRLLVLLVLEPVLARLLVSGRDILYAPVVVPSEEDMPLEGGDQRSDLEEEVGCGRGVVEVDRLRCYIRVFVLWQ